MSDLISRQAAIDGKICIQRANGVEIYDDYAVPVEYLKQLPPIQPVNCSEFPNNSDTISRQTAIDAAIEAADDWDGGCNIGRQKRIEKYIRQLPSAEPKKIRGQWSIKGQAIDTVRGYWATCSACGHSVFGGGNYCSNCGSYNKGEVIT